ncbi:MAG: class I SAM-dependent methyltransferase [Prosthecobacter sp.]|nr:class I SAM-dependent methyltransferase [Prosthecobacter sp.]
MSRAISFISAYKGMSIGSFRLLEIGAGNGVVGQELRRVGVGHLIGLDVSNIACEAAWRDRSTVYDDYIVADLDCLNEDMDRWLRKKIFNGLVAVASLGFADVAASAFRRALSFIQPKAFVAVTIKEDFLRGDDRTGFSQVFGDLRQNGFKQVFWERHIHRFSTSNEPIYYITLVLTNLT